MNYTTAWASPTLMAWATAVLLAGGPMGPAYAGTAEAAATSPGKWDDDSAASAGATLTIETFAGINSVGASQLTSTFATANIPTAAVCALCTFGTGVFDIGSRFGPDTWKGTVAKAGLTSYAQLVANYKPGATLLAFGMGKLSFIRPGTLVAEASTDATAPKKVRGGAYAKDPVPVAPGTYDYAGTIGGSYLIDETPGSTATKPTRLVVDTAGEKAWIEFGANDSNDSSYLTLSSKPIWDFMIAIDATSGSPTLAASFSYDPARLAIPGAPTNPSQFQSYANSLLSQVLAAPGTTLTGAGSLGMTLTISDAVTLFNGSYAAAGVSGGFSSAPDAIGFEYGVGAGVVAVAEPSAMLMVTVGLVLLLAYGQRRGGGSG